MVTGVAGGIGCACAHALVERGYHVVGMGRRPYEQVKDRFVAIADRFTYVVGDISSAEDRLRFTDVAAEAGEVFALVNVAGVAPKIRNDILDMSEESYDYVMDINVKGTLFLTQRIANLMLQNAPRDGVRGYIVNVSSISAYTSSTSRGEYCISKAGVSMITKLFADRLTGEGILVNEVCPGIILTDMTSAVKEKYDALIAEGLVPCGRWGFPDDVARAVVTLCDGTLGYTAGHSLIVDGGMHIRTL